MLIAAFRHKPQLWGGIALPDKLKCIVNETGPIVTADCRMCSFQKAGQRVPSIILIMHDVIAIHSDIKFDPFHLFWEDEHI